MRTFFHLSVVATVLAAAALTAPALPAGPQDKEPTPAPDILRPDKSGAGARYGARDPLKCTSKAEPKTGAPTAAQARAYFISGFEKEKGTGTLGELYLTDNVKVEVGKGRPFDRADGSGDADVTELVYPVRGSYTYYRCYPISSVHPEGKSCKKIVCPMAEGICYKTSFGDWKCVMADIRTGKTVDGYFPPPK